MAKFFDLYNLWNEFNLHNPQPQYVQNIFGKLLALNNKNRNRGEVVISDRELMFYCGNRSKSQITEAKKILVELGVLKYELHRKFGTVYTINLDAFKSQNGARVGAPFGAPRDFPFNACARQEIKERKKKEKKYKRKESPDVSGEVKATSAASEAPVEAPKILGYATDECLARLAAEAKAKEATSLPVHDQSSQAEVKPVEVKTLEQTSPSIESAPVEDVKESAQVEVKVEESAQVKEVAPVMTEEERLALEEAESRANVLRMIEQMREGDPELAVSMLEQYHATTTAEQHAAAMRILHPEQNINEPQASEEDVEITELEKEGLIDDGQRVDTAADDESGTGIEGAIPSGIRTAEGKTVDGDCDGESTDDAAGRAVNRKDLGRRTSNKILRKLRGRMLKKTGGLSNVQGRGQGSRVGTVCDGEASRRRTAAAPSEKILGTSSAHDVGDVHFDDGQSAGSAVVEGVRGQSDGQSVLARGLRHGQDSTGDTDCEGLVSARA